MKLTDESTNDEIIQFLKTQRDRLKKAEEKRAELKGQVTQVKVSIEQATKKLNDEYGLDSSEAAEADVKKLREQVVVEANALSEMLDKVEEVIE